VGESVAVLAALRSDQRKCFYGLTGFAFGESVAVLAALRSDQWKCIMGWLK